MTRQRLMAAADARRYLGLKPHAWRKVEPRLPKVYLPGLARPRYDVQALDELIAGQTGRAAVDDAHRKALEAVENW